MANYIGKVTARTNKFNEQEIKIGFGPQDWEKLGLQFNEWKNFVLKYSKEGKPYLVIDDWKPEQTARPSVGYEEEPQTDLPF